MSHSRERHSHSLALFLARLSLSIPLDVPCLTSRLSTRICRRPRPSSSRLTALSLSLSLSRLAFIAVSPSWRCMRLTLKICPSNDKYCTVDSREQQRIFVFKRAVVECYYIPSEVSQLTLQRVLHLKVQNFIHEFRGRITAVVHLCTNVFDAVR